MGFVKYEQDGFVGVITINRPEALNALNTEVIQDLDAVLDSIDLGTTRVLVVTGAGEKSFVAGADIAAMSTMTVQEAREFSKAETMFSVSWRHFRSRRSRLSTDLRLAVEMNLQ